MTLAQDFSPGSTAAAQPFEFAVSSSAACGSNVVATFDVADGALNLGTVSFDIHVGATTANTYSFSNSTLIKIPATGTGGSSAPASAPYPSALTVSGVLGTVVRTRTAAS